MMAAGETGMDSKSQRPREVIAGAGFAGLEASKALAKSDVDVALIDAQNHHCFQPLLYEVATAALSPADVAWPIRAILEECPGDHGARYRDQRSGAPRPHQRDRSCL
jgi:NADH:quinone reductase (non-electrogenic)